MRAYRMRFFGVAMGSSRYTSTSRRSTTTAVVVVLSLLVAACPGRASARPFPIEQFEETFRAEPVDIVLNHDERIQTDYSRDFRTSPQPFPSNPNGNRAGGLTIVRSDGSAFVTFAWLTTPSALSLSWPEYLDFEFGGGVDVRIDRDGMCEEATVEKRTVDITSPASTHERLAIDLDEQNELCAFAWPGALTHRILRLDQQPESLDDWFREIGDSPFTYSHGIRIHGDSVDVYSWETDVDGITEIREIGITRTGWLYYMNWWRSEPYPGELVNRRTVLRSLPDDKG